MNLKKEKHAANALYTQLFTTLDYSDAKSFFKYLRGVPQYPVCAVFEVPKGKNFLVGDIKIGSKEIRFGG